MSTNKSTSEIDSNDFHAPVSMQTNLVKDNGEAKSQQYNNKINKDDNHQIIQGDKNIINNITIKVDKDDSIVGASEKIGNPKEEINIEFIITGSLKNTINKRKLKAIEQHLKKIADDVELTIVDIEEGSLKFVLKGSPKGLKRIEELFNSGELTEIFDVPIESVKFVDNEKEKLAFTITGDISDTNVAKLKAAVTGVDEKELLIKKIRTNQSEKKLNLSGADLSGSNVSRSNLSEANLSGANLSGAYFSEANLSGAYFSRADFIGVNFSGANLIGANLIGANLIGANLIGANLSGANLIGANLSAANLSAANLNGANLNGADLSGADLSVADLSRAKFNGADLSEAYLRKADFSGADLSRANFFIANLNQANLSGANLNQANLSGANLIGANLIGAKLKYSKVTNTKFSSNSPGITKQLKQDLIQRGAIVEPTSEKPTPEKPTSERPTLVELTSEKPS